MLALVLLGTVLLVAMRVSDYLVALVFVNSTQNLRQLTVLIGNAWMLSYVVQLCLGLWLTPWLLAKAGVKNAILLLPVATLVGFALVAWAPGLGTSLFLFVVRNGLQTGVDDPAQNVYFTLSGIFDPGVAVLGLWTDAISLSWGRDLDPRLVSVVPRSNEPRRRG